MKISHFQEKNKMQNQPGFYEEQITAMNSSENLQNQMGSDEGKYN
jgi:hypothetical protein